MAGVVKDTKLQAAKLTKFHQLAGLGCNLRDTNNAEYMATGCLGRFRFRVIRYSSYSVHGVKMSGIFVESHYRPENVECAMWL